MARPQCDMLILRNDKAACLSHLFSPLSNVEFKKRVCPMSLHIYTPCRMSLIPMSQVKFKKSLYRPVDLIRGQWTLCDDVNFKLSRSCC